jgi:glycosyltransferase involved in cell wall biosynthesis
MKMCVLWQCYGPYHFARLKALQALCAEFGHEAVGLEISDRSSTYAWQRQGEAMESLTTLFPGEIAETISASRIYKRVKPFFRSAACHVVFTPGYSPLASYLAARAARSTGAAVVLMNDSHRATGNNSIFALTIKRLLCRIYAAAFVAGSVHRTFHRELGFSDDLIFEGYDAIDNDFFERGSDVARSKAAKTRARLKLPARYILSVGRFVEKKNLATLIEAYALARERGGLNGCDLVLVGDGPLKSDLMQLATRRGLQPMDLASTARRTSTTDQEIVRFYPFSQLHDLPSYYALADCFVLPSLREEWGLVVNEAMASGCPAIVTGAAGCAGDLIVTGYTGYTFAAESVETLASHLQEIGSNPSKAREMGRRARSRVRAWSCDQFAHSALTAAGMARDRRINHGAPLRD